jgi:hypothetical protein
VLLALLVQLEQQLLLLLQLLVLLLLCQLMLLLLQHLVLLLLLLHHRALLLLLLHKLALLLLLLQHLVLLQQQGVLVSSVLVCCRSLGCCCSSRSCSSVRSSAPSSSLVVQCVLVALGMQLVLWRQVQLKWPGRRQQLRVCLLVQGSCCGHLGLGHVEAGRCCCGCLLQPWQLLR